MYKDPMEMINLGSEEDLKEIMIRDLLLPYVKIRLINFLKECVYIFSWSYQDMPRLDTDIVEHLLSLKPLCLLIKQKLRRTHPDMEIKIKEEVLKQINASFLMTSVYPYWIANIVPFPKKYGKVRMCVDYRDLSKASPKDDFLSPHIKM